MCGRYSLVNTSKLAERFGVVQGSLDLAPHYNVAPSQLLPVVVRHSPNSIEMMRWGLVPFWSKEPKMGYSTINARAEGIEFKPAYRKPFHSQRCLVPADAFFEWKKTGIKGGKIPFLFRLHEGEVFAFAGLYDIYRSPGQKDLKTFTIITTIANPLMSAVHDRMPVILRREDEAKWLDPDISDPALLSPLLQPYPDELMEAYPVSLSVNRATNNTPDVLERLNSA